MALYSFDPRENIRTAIGYTKYVYDEDRSTVSVTDDWDDTLFIPLYLPGEVRTGDMPNMPFVEMTLITTPVNTWNIGGDVKEQDCYIDFNIYYTDTENITATTFGRTVANELVDKIIESRSSVASCYFMEVVNDGREIIEQVEGKQIIFHRVLEIHCKNYN